LGLYHTKIVVMGDTHLTFVFVSQGDVTLKKSLM